MLFEIGGIINEVRFAERDGDDSPSGDCQLEATRDGLDFVPAPAHTPSAMAQSARPRHHYTYADYLAYERDSRLKHEFIDIDNPA